MLLKQTIDNYDYNGQKISPPDGVITRPTAGPDFPQLPIIFPPRRTNPIVAPPMPSLDPNRSPGKDPYFPWPILLLRPPRIPPMRPLPGPPPITPPSGVSGLPETIPFRPFVPPAGVPQVPAAMPLPILITPPWMLPGWWKRPYRPGDWDDPTIA